MFHWINIILTWILFLSLFPLAFFWLRAAWRIGIKKDFSEVALQGVMAPPHPAKFAPYALLINAAAGVSALFVILSVLIGQAEYARWTMMAGMTIWCKLVANFILRRHAHKRPA